MDRSVVASTGSAVAIALSTVATAGMIAPTRLEARQYAPLRNNGLHVFIGGAMQTSDTRVVISVSAGVPSLADGDVVTLTEADIAMLEYAVSADPDQLDYSAFYDETS
jgi:hypothetical protein